MAAAAESSGGPAAARRLRVAFVHLDLGIGGAEQLVVNAALALQARGHAVTLCTTHHAADHCFAPTRGDGALARSVVVVGDWLPRTLGGRGTAFFSSLRMCYLALLLVCYPSLAGRADVVVVDGVSTPLPLLRWRFAVLFYCHHPDKLLCTARGSWLKRAYRVPLDWLEERTTAVADAIVVNSRYTRQVFLDAFPRLGREVNPAVVYPAADFSSFTKPDWAKKKHNRTAKGVGPFVSLNRFERKKNIGLAIEALRVVVQQHRADHSAFDLTGVRLIVAGGYDPALAENVEYLEELKALAKDLEVDEFVSFRPSVSDQERDELLQSALCVLYTPENEHFGIVPIEAMYAGAPVLAANSGGPLETVVDGETGFLRDNTADAFGRVLCDLLREPHLAWRLGQQANEHVQAKFGKAAFEAAMDRAVLQTLDARRRSPASPWMLLVLALVGAVLGWALMRVFVFVSRG